MVEWLAAFWQTYNTLVYLLFTHAILALSIYITLNTGLLSVGNAAFAGIGAYTSALLTMKLDLPFPVCLAAGSAAAGLVGLAIGLPVLRLSGVYLALATLAFGEVIRVVFLNLEVTGGAMGLNGIPPKTELWHLVLVCAALIYFFERLRRSRLGRTLDAIREDEVAARVMGIDVVYYKNLVFVLGAMLAGLAGGFNAHFTFFVSPREYGFGPAVDILAFAVLGGTGSYWGPILGSTILTLLPELLRFLADFRGMVTGLVLFLVIVYLPNGLLEVPDVLRRAWRRGAKP
ncbi:MAG TPA: branched-chain amino acid ABC transporter permease [Thermodesulfobacteriota bacterium]